jgi:hypothetical protein
MEACRPNQEISLENFMRFCRKSSILPDIDSASKLQALFARQTSKTANFNDFLYLLISISHHDLLHLKTLLIQITESSDVGMHRLKMGTNVLDAKAGHLTTLAWSRNSRTIVETTFDDYYRREYTRSHRGRTIHPSTLFRFLTDYNETAPKSLKIDRNSAMIAILKFKKRNRIGPISVDLFALLFEWHAYSISESQQISISAALNTILSVIQTKSTQSSFSTIALRDPKVCSTLLQFERNVQKLYNEFASAPSRYQAGLKLYQADLEKFFISVAIIPNLLTARQVLFLRLFSRDF